MVVRNKKNKLQRWEVALVKAMLVKDPSRNDQDILAYFTRPDRSINHARIAEIRKGTKHARTKAATEVELERFIESWPQIDPETGLHLLSDELLIKAREAMLVAVQSYNNPKTHFRSEVFIVTAIIAWTYLLHAYYRARNVDYRHKVEKKEGTMEARKTRKGADKYWELSACLKAPQCPVEDEGTIRNLVFLIDIRDEIEHRMTQRIDGALSAKLQACCLNFNRTLKALFGDRYGLDSDLSFALQFSSIDIGQKKALIDNGSKLPNHIEAVRASLENGLTEEQYNDPNYAYRVLFVPKTVNKRAQADEVVEFVRAGSDEAVELNKIYLREVDRPRYRPMIVVQKMQAEGFAKFSIHHHTKQWQALEAKNSGKGYGVETESDGWRWNNRWIECVRTHCEENRAKYE